MVWRYRQLRTVDLEDALRFDPSVSVRPAEVSQMKLEAICLAAEGAEQGMVLQERHG